MLSTGMCSALWTDGRGDNTFGAPKGLTVVSPVRQIQFTLRYEF